MTSSFLYTAIDGAPDGAPFFVLHKRYGDLNSARTLGEVLGDDVRRVAVRSSRVQVSGPNGRPHGCFWFIGPLDGPELSTLGDGLFQLEKLMLDEMERVPGQKLSFLGEGEGAVVAMLTAMLWGDKAARLILIDPYWPGNLDQMPIEAADLSELKVLLVGDDAARLETVRSGLAARGAAVQLGTQADIGGFAKG